MKWSRMVTPAGDLVYPRGLDSTAIQLAYRINSAYLLDDKEVLYEMPGKRITTILQNQSAIPEGFATTAPWRQEFFLTPPQNMFMGPSIWKDALATHEYRHAQQFMAYNRGFTNFYKVLMGNTGWVFNSVLSMPLWYREGDAVDAETRFTTGGRGTLPAFNMEHRTLLLNGVKYPYEKAVSALNFKDFVPNHYRTGYYMTRHLRAKYTPEIWGSIVEGSTRRLIYPFSGALKNKAKNQTPEFYELVMDSLKTEWLKTDTIQSPVGTRISPPQSIYTNFRFPQMDHSGKLIFSHQSLQEIRTISMLKDQQKEKILTPGIYTPDHENFTVEGSKISWAESAFHPRYRNKIYSVIKLHDLISGKTRQISHRSKLFSPAPSPDGKWIAAIKYDEFENCSLVIINADNEFVQSAHVFKNKFLAQPRWINEREIVMVSIDESGNKVVLLDIEDNEWTVLLDAFDINISQPFPHENYIYFSAGLNGIENIYSIDRNSGKTLQLTNSRFGAFDPAVYNDTLYFSNYDINGYEIWFTPLDRALNKPVVFPDRAVHMSHAQYFKDEVKGTLDSTLFIDSEYKGFFWNKFFHFYGWFPLIAPPEYGIELNTLNLERSFKSLIGLSYHTDEKLFQTKIQFDYAKFFPIISGVANIKTRDFEYSDFEFNPDSIPSVLTNEKELGGQITIPLRLTQGVYHSNLSISGGCFTHQIENLESSATMDFNSYRYSFSFSRIRPRAVRHINSRFGQVLNFNQSRGFDQTDPEQISLNASLFFPGLSKTHSFYVSGGMEENNQTADYRFQSKVRGSRGYDFYPFDQQNAIRFNYEFPLVYPDKYVRGVLGTSRVRLNFFYDYTEGSSMEWIQLQRSYGLELGFDVRLLRAFNMGLRLQFSQAHDRVSDAKPLSFNLLVDYFEFAN